MVYKRHIINDVFFDSICTRYKKERKNKRRLREGEREQRDRETDRHTERKREREYKAVKNRSEKKKKLFFFGMWAGILDAPSIAERSTLRAEAVERRQSQP